MTDRPEGDGSQAHEAAPAAPRASSAKRGVKTSHLVWGATAALVAIAAVVGGLQAADDAPGVQLVGWRGGWHQGAGGPGQMWRICSDQRDDWLAERIELIEEFVTFTSAQAPAWKELTQAVDAASAKVDAASAKVDAACEPFEAADRPATAPARLEQAELMLATGLDVVQGLRPAVDGFYATLEPEQKAALDRMASRRDRDD